jgi:hypothetical protein
MGTPQIIVMIILVLGLGISMEKHGKDRTGKENFLIQLISTIIMAILLWWGGFWK